MFLLSCTKDCIVFSSHQQATFSFLDTESQLGPLLYFEADNMNFLQFKILSIFLDQVSAYRLFLFISIHAWELFTALSNFHKCWICQ